MKTKKVLMSVIGGFVIGTLIGVIMTSVVPHEGKKRIAKMTTEYRGESSTEHSGVYAIL